MYSSLFVCWFVCLSVSRITQKVKDGFEQNITGGSQLPKDHSITF